jgi:hypothetical protein
MKTRAFVLFAASVLLSCAVRAQTTAMLGRDYSYGDTYAAPVAKDSRQNNSALEYHVTWYKTDELKSVNADYVDKHILGDEIARKLYLLDKTFTYSAPVAPGNPAQRTMVRKPVIYRSVVDVEKQLRRDVRKNEIAPEEAKSKLNHVLDVALNTFCVETDELEKILSQKKDTKEVLEFYTGSVRVVKQ